MKDRKRIALALDYFNDNYPRPGIGPISIEGEYDLVTDWPKDYPNIRSAGVYIFLDKESNLLYIGKTSCNNTFGYRLTAYFNYGPRPERKCKIKNDYYSDVRKILLIPLPKDHIFEAGAIEEYLIEKLNPKLNVIGKKASNNVSQSDA